LNFLKTYSKDNVKSTWPVWLRATNVLQKKLQKKVNFLKFNKF